jgi:hypothetical protein
VNWSNRTDTEAMFFRQIPSRRSATVATSN